MSEHKTSRLAVIAIVGFVAIASVVGYLSWAESHKKALEAEYDRLHWRIFDASAKHVKEMLEEQQIADRMRAAGSSGNEADAFAANLCKEDREDVRRAERDAEGEMHRFLTAHPEIRKPTEYPDL